MTPNSSLPSILAIVFLIFGTVNTLVLLYLVLSAVGWKFGYWNGFSRGYRRARKFSCKNVVKFGRRQQA